MMDEPNRPSIVATKKNIERPPPMAIAFLLRSNQQEARKQMPLIANMLRNAPRLISSSFCQVRPVSTSTMFRQTRLVTTVQTNIASSEPTR